MRVPRACGDPSVASSTLSLGRLISLLRGPRSFLQDGRYASARGVEKCSPVTLRDAPWLSNRKIGALVEIKSKRGSHQLPRRGLGWPPM